MQAESKSRPEKTARWAFFFLIGAGGVTILLWLGSWQLARLEWKESLLATMEARLAAAPIPLPAAASAEDHLFQAVKLDATFTGERLFVLTSLKPYGPGYHVIERAIIDAPSPEERSVLVDRGFLSEALKEAELSIGPAEIIGNLHWPNEFDRFTPEADGNLWFGRDVEKMALTLETDALLVVASKILPDEERLIETPPDTTRIPNNHLQYAITWFSLAAIWASMSIWFSFGGGIKPRR